jgi:hypothetical protein
MSGVAASRRRRRGEEYRAVAPSIGLALAGGGPLGGEFVLWKSNRSYYL